MYTADEPDSKELDDLGYRAAKLYEASLRLPWSGLRRRRKRVASYLERRWRRGFDLFDSLLEYAATLGQVAIKLGCETQDATFEAVLMLHTNGFRTASEISALLRTGHGAGAYARWRTMYEVLVQMAIIAEHGNDLAQRFLDHYVVQHYRIAKRHHEITVKQGVEPLFTADDVAMLKADCDELITKYGPGYEKDYGWAAVLLPPGQRLTFRSLAEIADLDTLGADYALSSFDVHAGSATIAHSYDAGSHRAGPYELDLAQPGEISALVLTDITERLMAQVDTKLSESHRVMLSAMRHMATRTGHVLSKIESDLRKRRTHRHEVMHVCSDCHGALHNGRSLESLIAEHQKERDAKSQE